MTKTRRHVVIPGCLALAVAALCWLSAPAPAAPEEHQDGHAPAAATSHDAHDAHGVGAADAHDAHGAEAHTPGHGDGHHERHFHEHEPHHIPPLIALFKTAFKKTYIDASLLHDTWVDRGKARHALKKARAAKEPNEAEIARLEAQIVAFDEELTERKEAYGHHGLVARTVVALYKNSNGVIALLVVLIWTVVAMKAYKARSHKPKGWGTFGEMLVGVLWSFYEPILGHETRRYFPFLATLFCFIWMNNLMSIVPGAESPSGVFWNNFGLGLTVFLFVQYIGLSRLGPKKVLMHWMGDPPMPIKENWITWLIGVALIPLELLGELIRPVSLSLRLFGNIMGEDILLLVFMTLGIQIIAGVPGLEYMPIGIPLHLPMFLLVLLGSTIQALVFTMLSAVYISMKVPHDHGHAEHGEEAHAHAH